MTTSNCQARSTSKHHENGNTPEGTNPGAEFNPATSTLDRHMIPQKQS
eukprot:CAMPEP_0204454460 /NCGR_PEP_ID=MMETSP0471-20130131/13_1 /ASSEMBLY_ACC=CAM_ASM_000602 /TAXON_ID=2969 /ORGANISM="Oxyrrhis marina" /LENGTH=47 /DNA_ID= /DNA_START= /DNA_END= /DNA_ORIENTATION=